jgi:hypothetical protein
MTEQNNTKVIMNHNGTRSYQFQGMDKIGSGHAMLPYCCLLAGAEEKHQGMRSRIKNIFLLAGRRRHKR